GLGLAVFSGGSSLAVAGAVLGVASVASQMAADNTTGDVSALFGDVAILSGLAGIGMDTIAGVSAIRGDMQDGARMLTENTPKRALLPKEQPSDRPVLRGGGDDERDAFRANHQKRMDHIRKQNNPSELRLKENNPTIPREYKSFCVDSQLQVIEEETYSEISNELMETNCDGWVTRATPDFQQTDPYRHLNKETRALFEFRKELKKSGKTEKDTPIAWRLLLERACQSYK
ncbi:hypothetical protein, partial [Citrobacter koseri]|uniref:hypothetical protein n=1 Tax=Citrobacter koseri TaxID=545 RepID=UPI001F435564